MFTATSAVFLSYFIVIFSFIVCIISTKYILDSLNDDHKNHLKTLEKDYPDINTNMKL